MLTIFPLESEAAGWDALTTLILLSILLSDGNGEFTGIPRDTQEKSIHLFEHGLVDNSNGSVAQ